MEISWRFARWCGADAGIVTLPLRHLRARPGQGRAARRRRPFARRAAGVRAARPAGREPRAPGPQGRDRREGLGRPRRVRCRSLAAASSRRARRSATTASRSASSGRSTARASASSPRSRSRERQPSSTVRRRELPAGQPSRTGRATVDRRAAVPARSATPGPYATIADALPHELITELSRLRWLFVTARGSSFRLRAEDADMGEIGRVLGVRYCLSGTVEVAGPQLVVTVELVDTRRRRRRLGGPLCRHDRRRARDPRGHPRADR